MSFKADDCILIMGRRGSGKTYLGQRLQKIWPRRVVLDTLADYSEGDVVRSFNEFAEKMRELKNSGKNNFVVIYKFDPEREITENEINEILRLCYYFGGIQVVIEEVHNFSSPHKLPKWFRQCLLTGRHQNLSLMVSTQRPGELNKTILSQCSHIFCGNLIEGNDLKYVANFLGQSSEKLVSLPPRRFLYFDPAGRVQEISNDF